MTVNAIAILLVVAIAALLIVHSETIRSSVLRDDE